MARRGGYGRSTNTEWMETTRQHYAEAIRSADDMGQDLMIWLCDAIAFHAYYCERVLAQERFAEADRRASAELRPSPLKSDYMPTRPAPTITTKAGQGSAPGNRSYRR